MNHLTIEQIANKVGISVRMVRRYIASEGIAAAAAGPDNRNLYSHASGDQIKDAVMAARERKAEAVRAGVARRTMKTAAAPSQPEHTIITVAQAKKRALKGGRP